MGGFGFAGDNRGFSFMPRGSVTSRVGGRWKIDTRKAEVSQIEVYSDASHAPWGTQAAYNTPETRPTGRILRNTISPFTEDSLQAVSLRVHTRGKNQAFTSSPMINNIVVPDLDVIVDITMQFDRHKGTVRITSNLLGDGFPNSEVFMVDSLGSELMLNTHHRIGHASGQLIGNHGHILASSEIIVGIDDSDNFVDL